MKNDFKIPIAKLAGYDDPTQERGERSNSLVDNPGSARQASNTGQNTPEGKAKKIEWPQLILGIIGMIVGTFLTSISSGPLGALILIIVLVVFFAIYSKVKGKI